MRNKRVKNGETRRTVRSPYPGGGAYQGPKESALGRHWQTRVGVREEGLKAIRRSVGWSKLPPYCRRQGTGPFCSLPKRLWRPCTLRPSRADKIQLPDDCGNVALHVSRRVAYPRRDPSELLPCPKVAEQSPSRPGPNLANIWPTSAQLGRIWPK